MKIKDYSDIDVLEAYLLGDLDPRDMYEVEKLSLEDPFVGQALEGLRQSKQLRYNLSLLQKQLQQKVAEKPILKKRWQITSQRLSIASAAAVLLITVSILFWMKSGAPKKVDEPVSVVLADRADKNPMESANKSTDNSAVERTVENELEGATAVSAAKPIAQADALPASATPTKSLLAIPSAAVAETPMAKAAAPMAKAAIPFRGVYGLIKDSISGHTISEVQITLTELSLSTRSTRDGSFKISIQDEVKFPIKVQISALGYEELLVTIDSLNTEHIWLLKPIINNGD